MRSSAPSEHDRADDSDRVVPLPDDLSAPFWAAAGEGRLVVQRCTRCRTYAHPPRAYCVSCESEDLAFEPVSGRGVVYSYTRTESGARQPYFERQVPYLVGLVELEEQDGLLFLSNFPGAELTDLRAGVPVEVVFDPVGEAVGDVTAIPQFRLTGAADEAVAP